MYMLSLTVQDLRAERDRLVQEIQDWRTYAQSLVQEMEKLWSCICASYPRQEPLSAFDEGDNMVCMYLIYFTVLLR